jgi:7,8-dihydropterin-6-yl-methyl-4-(beta-D-ribofuranosyl)aminobenzene 5'-phosphate synthase
MKAIILVDNIAGEQLKQEWGLAIFIEYEGKNILLDTGGSKLYLDNAKKLDVDIRKIDYGVLSHAIMTTQTAWKAFFMKTKKQNFICVQAAGKIAT